MKWHSLTAIRSLSELGVNRQAGLSAAEVKRRLSEYGLNKIDEKRSTSLFSKFAEQFKDFMIMVLIAGAAISFITSAIEGNADYIDPIIILAIVILNAVMGVVQESRAEKALDALRKISAPTATVRRNGKLTETNADEIVPGDIIILETGNFVPADARLLSCTGLMADESSLTGESAPVEKRSDSVLGEKTSLADRVNMVYASTSVTEGRGEALVVGTGMKTEMGRIAGMIISCETPQTPLQKKLSGVGKILGIGALLICAFVFVIGIISSIPPLDMFMTSISLAVAAIPEGLPATVTIMLAMGVKRMVKKNAIVRNLPAVETLGSASVICSDKTGTLTQNKMTVKEISCGRREEALTLGCLCCNCDIRGGEAVGSPTENAIVNAAYKQGIIKRDLDKAYERIAEIPFDSTRKLMTTVHRYRGGYRVISKGAPDILTQRCTHYFENGEMRILTPTAKRALLEKNSAMAGKALRVIAVAYKDINTLPSKVDTAIEGSFVFSGLIGMIDPPRPEVPASVKLCKKAGIRPVMITGDHGETAGAIAREIGILSGGERVVSGSELDNMSQNELVKNIYNYPVFARVTPRHKVRIVKAFQDRGDVVAMTGDGVNDAPALKTADIGCAMGIGGTDVAKGASDMILTDDNFATIVEAVAQGRGIFANIRKVVHFLLSSNIGEIITIFAGLLFGWPPPLVAIQLLWVNLVTDSLPALALGVDPVSSEVMNEKPRSPKESLFADKLGVSIALEGCMIGILALLAFSIGFNVFGNGRDPITGRTMAFCVLSISQLVHAFNVRSCRSAFKEGIFSNKYLVGAFIICLFMQVSVVTIAPAARIFKVVPLSGIQWVLVGILSLMPLILLEIQKWVNRKS